MPIIRFLLVRWAMHRIFRLMFYAQIINSAPQILFPICRTPNNQHPYKYLASLRMAVSFMLLGIKMATFGKDAIQIHAEDKLYLLATDIHSMHILVLVRILTLLDAMGLQITKYLLRTALLIQNLYNAVVY